MDDPREDELERLGKYLQLHPLAIEDAVQAHQRPKQERYGGVLSVAVKTLWFVERTADVETGEVMIFLGPSFALTVRHGALDPTVEAACRWKTPAIGTSRTGERPAYGHRRDRRRLHAGGGPGPCGPHRPGTVCVLTRREDLTEQIYTLKREVVEFRDAVGPLVPVVQQFTAPHDDCPRQMVPYFRDVADHLTRTDTEVRALDDLLGSVLDAHLAKVGTWQNDDMRRISAWAASWPSPP
ncbi:hypothetical protein E4K10_00055 [Streptomyces sp. T1317-0309]|nr:hypothetical protein E4K10_00055 [Streptomyces sp. T1317-0309]